MSQNKASFRKQLRSSLTHKRLADVLADKLQQLQVKVNTLADKLDADDTATLDVNYLSTIGMTADFDGDAKLRVQFIQPHRKALISAMQNKRVANAIIDAIDSLETNYDALLAKLDAQAGTLADVDHVSLAVVPFDPDQKLSAQHRQSVRKVVQHMMANKSAGSKLLDSLYQAELSFNAILVQLDVDALAATGALLGIYTPLKQVALDPDQSY